MSFFMMQARQAGAVRDRLDLDPKFRWGIGSLQSDYIGRTPMHPDELKGARTAVIITAGQSLIANRVTAGYTQANPTLVGNLSQFDGGIYRCQEPLLGTSGASVGNEGNYAMRLADKLIANNKATRVVIAPIAMGGSTIAHWGADGQHTDRIIAVCERLRLHGLTPAYSLAQQGESDHNTDPTVYTNRLNDTIGVFRAQGVNCPFYICLSTWLNGVTKGTIRTAQQACVNNAANVYLGPNSDNLDASNRSDNTHYNATGANAIADLWVPILHSV
jgi:hypothetical protein